MTALVALTFGFCLPLQGQDRNSVDLAVTGEYAPAFATVGEPLAFHIVVSNHGPGTAAGARITLPVTAGFTVQSIECEAIDGGPCPKTIPLSALRQKSGLALPALSVGQALRLKLSGVAVGSAATVVQTVRIQPPDGIVDPQPGNNRVDISATIEREPRRHAPRSAPTFARDTSTSEVSSRDPISSRELIPLATTDLAVEKTGPPTAERNKPLSFAITVANNGGEAADGAILRDPKIVGFAGSTVSCQPSNGAQCPSDLSVWALENAGLIIPGLPAGSNIAFTLNGNVEHNAVSELRNTATIDVPAGMDDSDLGNNTATDVVPIPAIFLNKTPGSVQLFDPGRGMWVARFTVAVSNQGVGRVTYGELIDTPIFPPPV